MRPRKTNEPCIRCGVVKRDPKCGSYCRECKRIIWRNHYKKNVEALKQSSRERFRKNGKERLKKYRKKYPEKVAARKEFHSAISRGIIKKYPCCYCNLNEAEGHHEDYSKPLEVIWLCRKHHAKLHRDSDFRTMIINQPNTKEDK